MTIKMGILGFGGMGNWHFNNAPKVEGVTVLAVHDIDPQRLKDARALGLKAYEDRAAFLADPDINFVLVATPNQFHRDYVVEALNAGKHVMCEKPVALSVAELDDMIAASERSGKLFTVHHNRRWDKDYLVLRHIVEKGMLGKVYSIESRVYGNNGQIYGWRQFPEAGGGMVYDWGIHLLDQFTFMYPDKRIVQVFAQTFSVINPLVDDLFKVELVFEGGPSVHVQVGTFGLRPAPRFYIYGDQGSAQIDNFSGKEGCITRLVTRMEEMGKVIVDTEAGPTRTMAPQPESCFEHLPLPEVPGHWSDLYKNLVDVLEGRGELIVTPATIRRTMQVIEAVFESARKGTSVSTSI